MRREQSQPEKIFFFKKIPTHAIAASLSFHGWKTRPYLPGENLKGAAVFPSAGDKNTKKMAPSSLVLVCLILSKRIQCQADEIPSVMVAYRTLGRNLLTIIDVSAI